MNTGYRQEFREPQIDWKEIEREAKMTWKNRCPRCGAYYFFSEKACCPECWKLEDYLPPPRVPMYLPLRDYWPYLDCQGVTLGDLHIGEDAWTLHWAFNSTYPAYHKREPNTMTVQVRRVYGGFVKVWCGGMPDCVDGEFVRFNDNPDYVDATIDGRQDKWDRTKEKLAKDKIESALQMTRDAQAFQERARTLIAEARELTREARGLLE